MRGPLRGEQLKRGHLDPVQAVGLPLVAPVGGGEGVRVGVPRPGPRQQAGHVETGRGRLLERRHGDGQRGAGGRAHGGVLVAEELPALADHGSNSASSSSQPVPSSSNRPALSAAARIRSIRRAVSDSPKKGRPVRVHTAPSASPGAPNLARAAARSRQTSATAREPMCFSSHTTWPTPSAR